MPRIKLGQVDYINCLPVYHALEENLLPVICDLVKGTPTRLNDLFLKDRLHVTPISSIEYANNSKDCIILPQMCISADGKVDSILLFSKVPVTELEGKKVYLTSSSATSVALLKILFEHYYHVEASYETIDPNLDLMLEKGDAALLIGDDAMRAQQMVKNQNLSVQIADLGEVWKEFTGEKMICSLWVVKKTFAENNPETVNSIVKTLHDSREIGLKNIPDLVEKVHKRTNLPIPVLENCFNTTQYNFGEDEKKALLTFFDYAYKSDLLSERIQLKIWGEEDNAEA